MAFLRFRLPQERILHIKRLYSSFFVSDGILWLFVLYFLEVDAVESGEIVEGGEDLGLFFDVETWLDFVFELFDVNVSLIDWLGVLFVLEEVVAYSYHDILDKIDYMFEIIVIGINIIFEITLYGIIDIN
jgi:hypothetical protein